MTNFILKILSIIGISFIFTIQEDKIEIQNDTKYNIIPVKNECNALVLSGGGSFGSYQNGIVSNLILNKNKDWDVFSGVSSGSINAVYLSQFKDVFNKTSQVLEMRDLWSSLKNNDLYRDEFFLNGLSLYNTKPLRQTLKNIFDDTIIKKDVIVSATSLKNKGKKTWINNEIQNNIVDVIMASTALPFVLPPHKFKDDIFLDGGVTSNILLDEVVEYCYLKYSKSNINIDIVLSSPYGKKINNVHNYDENILQIYTDMYYTITLNLMYNQLDNIKALIKNNKNNIKITVYERDGLDEVNHIDFEKGMYLWNKGFKLENTKIYDINS